jgi:hypothetical protein
MLQSNIPVLVRSWVLAKRDLNLHWGKNIDKSIMRK